MAPFEELQNLWQRQPARGPGAAQLAETSAAFRRYGRRSEALYYGKSIVVAMCTVFIVNRLRHRPQMIFGACLAIFSAVLFLIHDWRAQRLIARLNFADASTAFLRAAIERLREQQNPFRAREYYIAMGGFWVGLTIMLAGDWQKYTLVGIAGMLALITAAPLFVYLVGRVIRGRRYRKHCVPLIERLTAMLESMEGSRA